MKIREKNLNQHCLSTLEDLNNETVEIEHENTYKAKRRNDFPTDSLQYTLTKDLFVLP